MEYKVFFVSLHVPKTQTHTQIQKLTTMKEYVFVAAKRSSENGYVFYGIFSTEENAMEEAKNHYGAFVMKVKLDQATWF